MRRNNGVRLRLRSQRQRKQNSSQQEAHRIARSNFSQIEKILSTV